MKNTTFGFVLGICLTITVLAVWYNYTLNKRIANLEVFAGQVANIINNSVEKK